MYQPATSAMMISFIAMAKGIFCVMNVKRMNKNMSNPQEAAEELDLRQTIEVVIAAWKERVDNLNMIKNKEEVKNNPQQKDYLQRVEGKLIELDFCIRDLERQLNA